MQGKHDHTSWSNDGVDRPRVLLECPSAASPSIIADLVARSGYEVRTCIGPEGRHRCDLVDSGSCELVSGADVVVNMLDVRREGGRSVAEAVLAERRPPQLIVEVAQPDLPLDGLNLTGAEVIATPVHAGRLLGSIRKMLAGRALPADWWGGGAT
jgi:hypothetical protein